MDAIKLSALYFLKLLWIIALIIIISFYYYFLLSLNIYKTYLKVYEGGKELDSSPVAYCVIVVLVTFLCRFP